MATKDFFLFGSWFASKSLTESTMEVFVDIIGMIKTNTRGFCNDTIYNLTKYLPVGSYLVLNIKYMVTRDR